MILYFKHIIHIDDSPSTGTCLGYKGILTDSHLLIDDQEKGFVNVKHVTVVKCKCHGMHTCTPQLFDKNLTVHNRLHNTKNMMHTQCHAYAWFHDIVSTLYIG